MKPIDRIREEYRAHPREEPFDYYLEWHLENGFVFSTPDFFIMGRAIKLYAEEANTLHGIDNFAVWERSEENAWYVHAASGDLAKAWDVLPYPLGWLTFERMRDGKRELTTIALERIKRKTHEFSEHILAPARV